MQRKRFVVAELRLHTFPDDMAPAAGHRPHAPTNIEAEASVFGDACVRGAVVRVIEDVGLVADDFYLDRRGRVRARREHRRNVALQFDRPVAFFPLEMSAWAVSTCG